MLTVSEAVQDILKKSVFLEEALARGILNVSALSRRLLPEVRRAVMKDVREGAVVMAVNRFARSLRTRRFRPRRVFPVPPDLMLRSNLFEITLVNSARTVLNLKKLLDLIGGRPAGHFLTFTRGIFETTIIADRELKPKVLLSFQKEKTLSTIDHLSAITVRLPKGSADIPGVFHFILSALAWEEISVVEVVSTLNEFTMILKDKDTDRVFTVIKRLF